jgi:hypothetical protein
MSRQITVDRYVKRGNKFLEAAQPGKLKQEGIPGRIQSHCLAPSTPQSKLGDSEKECPLEKDRRMPVEVPSLLCKRKPATLDEWINKDQPKNADPQWFKRDMTCSALEIEERNLKQMKPNPATAYFLTHWMNKGHKVPAIEQESAWYGPVKLTHLVGHRSQETFLSKFWLSCHYRIQQGYLVPAENGERHTGPYGTITASSGRSIFLIIMQMSFKEYSIKAG